MKKLILSVIMAMMVSFAMAQSNDGKKAPQPMTAETMTEMMVSKLSLNSKQASQLKALNTEFADLFKHPGGKGGPKPDKDMKQGEKKEPPQMTAEMKAEFAKHQAKRKAYDSKLKKILTDKQYTEYQSMKPKRKAKQG